MNGVNRYSSPEADSYHSSHRRGGRVLEMSRDGPDFTRRAEKKFTVKGSKADVGGLIDQRRLENNNIAETV